MKIPMLIRNAQQWVFETPERALEQAYQAVLKIKAIEDEHFNGQKVASEASEYGDSVIAYFQGEVRRYLKITKARLIEFKTSRLFLNLSEGTASNIKTSNPDSSLNHSGKAILIIDKLNFIDQVIAKYEQNYEKNGGIADFFFNSLSENQGNTNSAIVASRSQSEVRRPPKNQDKHLAPDSTKDNNNSSSQTISDKTGVLPRSFLSTLKRLKEDMDPESVETEEQVLKRYRKSRYKTAISIKFILVLIIVPLLTHQLSKTFFFKPLVQTYFQNHHQEVLFINRDLEEDALMELQKFEASFHFKTLLGIASYVSPEEKEKQMKEKAVEIAENFRQQGADAISNVFADLTSLIAFGIIIFTSRKEIEILKSFIDEIVYGLSDSAKAFLIILFTDMFVGFHSPHGWEVILQGIARHLGLPQNQDFDFLFIATFPVILDTVFKYWIFRYLNRVSPSAVATYRNMNE
jgi:hypothetical protein